MRNLFSTLTSALLYLTVAAAILQVQYLHAKYEGCHLHLEFPCRSFHIGLQSSSWRGAESRPTRLLALEGNSIILRLRRVVRESTGCICSCEEDGGVALDCDLDVQYAPRSIPVEVINSEWGSIHQFAIDATVIVANKFRDHKGNINTSACTGTCMADFVSINI